MSEIKFGVPDALGERTFVKLWKREGNVFIGHLNLGSLGTLKVIMVERDRDFILQTEGKTFLRLKIREKGEFTGELNLGNLGLHNNVELIFRSSDTTDSDAEILFID